MKRFVKYLVMAALVICGWLLSFYEASYIWGRQDEAGFPVAILMSGNRVIYTNAVEFRYPGQVAARGYGEWRSQGEIGPIVVSRFQTGGSPFGVNTTDIVAIFEKTGPVVYGTQSFIDGCNEVMVSTNVRYVGVCQLVNRSDTRFMFLANVEVKDAPVWHGWRYHDKIWVNLDQLLWHGPIGGSS